MQNLPINIITKEVPNDGKFIGDLPYELLREICKYLPYGEDLVGIATIHSRFKAVVMPMLYKSIRLRACQATDNDYLSKGRHELPACLVSDPKGQSLMSFPSFCPHVQKLSLKVMSTNWYTNAKGHRQLLNWLPRIRDLSLDPPPRKYEFPVSNRLTTMRMTLPYEFARFRNPHLWPAYLDLKEYLSKPSLRNIQIENQHDRFYYKTIHTGNTRSSTIVDVRLINWHPEDVHVLETVLPSIIRLKSFMIDVDGQWRGPPPPPSVYPREILAPRDYGRLLQLHKESLEYMMVGYCHHVYINFDGRDLAPYKAPQVMGSLSSYCRLKRLAIPEHFLVTGGDQYMGHLLPPNLEELQIQISGAQDWHRDDRQREDIPSYHVTTYSMALTKNEYLPRLERVVLWIQTVRSPLFSDDTYVYTLNPLQASRDPHKNDFYNPFREHMTDIAELFDEANVKFEVVLARNFKETPFAEYLYLQ